MKQIERITHLSLSEIFTGEATEFTPWLSQNLDRITDLCGVTIIEPTTEVYLPTLRVDIVAKTISGDKVIIENQFGKSDHDHLGKLLSYAATLGAKYAFWVCEEARPEHIEAVKSLKHIDCIFVLLEARGMKIGDSDPALDFRIASGSKEIVCEEGTTLWQQTNREWWSFFLPKCGDELPDFGNRAPSTDQWLDVGAGVNGIRYNIIKRKDGYSVQLIFGSADKELNTRRYLSMLQHKEEIETLFGEPMTWREMPENKSCIIEKQEDGLGYMDTDKWETLSRAIIGCMRRFQQATKPFIQS